MNPKFNPLKQHSVATEVSISGAGLHTGVHVKMTLKPAKPGFGYRFQRMDLPGQPVIPADCDLVSNSFRCTTLSSNGATIATVEHVLAALVGSGIDNCLIEVNGPELPIIDGSCSPFVHLIEQAGRVEQNVRKNWITLDTEIMYFDPEKNVTMVATPCDEYSIHTHIDFKGGVLQNQHARLDRIENFKSEIAPCRTYCFVHELEMLIDKGLIQGDIVKNVILIIDKPVSAEEKIRLQKKFNIRDFALHDGGYLNNQELHFDNEIARHKLMDVVGDLALTGFPIHAKILASRPGHSTNVEFAKRLKQYILQTNGKIAAMTVDR
jgi:UDP-3-O-[3-hydroxymyristoyl] N-acetylglucosamine deacetylase / 3-hydroxyacyl-[acyl-carrier-protein] dehydratase